MKKGNINSLHENSRDSQKLRRAGAREQKLLRIATARAKVNQTYRMLTCAASWGYCHMLTVYRTESGLFPGRVEDIYGAF